MTVAVDNGSPRGRQILRLAIRRSVPLVDGANKRGK